MSKTAAGRRDAGYLDAVSRLMKRIEAAVADVDAAQLPLRVVIAGDAAAFLHTGVRTSRDIDASLSLRVHLPNDLEEAYVDRHGEPASVYLDPNYNDTPGPLHECAHDDAQSVPVAGIDPRRLDVRMLAPIDLAISKLGRFSEHDRDDIIDMARAGLLDADAFNERAAEALDYYVGRPAAPRANLREAATLIRANTPPPKKPSRRRS
ncbi:MAG TPA: DUF6036 family nucleotidyltransferase [Casimicrobiaceae bacterium]